MSPFNDQVMRHAQATAIAHAALRTPVDALARQIAVSMKAERRAAEVETALRSALVQQALFERDVALWFGSDGLVRLVDQQPGGLGAARLRLQHPPRAGVCRYCLLREAASLVPELESDVDAYGQLVSGSFIHSRCRRAWRRLQSQVGRIEEVPAS
ncbi:hypothetical protein [Polaromonas sp. JS666]|uniref:hypothetical protein n=1 Tax=Polaromonas sp. (strain JS666 / ATCC BAA-500) TaxID=296591 RepID=UPI000046496B|nr:hypothetical protein [Polaromonas sp. JS666]ABE43261.1 hypothetical protein Bpro_1311 [Polaromonas sp. JS666]